MLTIVREYLDIGCDDININQRYIFIFEILTGLTGREKISHFNMDFLIRNDNNMIMSFVIFLRELYDGKHDYRNQTSNIKNYDTDLAQNKQEQDHIKFTGDINRLVASNNMTFNNDSSEGKYYKECENDPDHVYRNLDYKINNYSNYNHKYNLHTKHYNDRQHYSNKSTNDKIYYDDINNVNTKFHEEKNQITRHQVQNNDYDVRSYHNLNKDKKDDKNSNLSMKYNITGSFNSNENYKFSNVENKNNNNMISNHNRNDDEDIRESQFYKNFEIKSLASQMMPSENKKKYSFSKTYETDRDERAYPDDECDTEVEKLQKTKTATATANTLQNKNEKINYYTNKNRNYSPVGITKSPLRENQILARVQ